MSARIIKECYEKGESRSVWARCDHYGRGLNLYLNLFEALKADFPFLEPKDAECVVYAGNRYARTIGLEVKLADNTEIPDDYIRVLQAEYIY